jgi:hypothetical protein
MGFDPSWAFRDCPWCRAHDVQMNVTSHFNTGGAASSQRSWSVLSCPRCAMLTILERSADGTTPDSIHSTLPRDEDLKHDVESLPDDVAGYYENARKALMVGLPDSAGVELRRTLEAATSSFGAGSGPLYKRVQNLIADGHVTKVFDPALGYIRKIGNIGAHAAEERLSELEVRQALTFTTLLLRNLFELPAQVRALEAEAPPPPVEEQADNG